MGESNSQPSFLTGFWEHVDELVRRFKVILIALILAIGIEWIPTSWSGITNPIEDYQPIVSLIMLKLKHDFLPSQATLIAGGMASTVYAMAYLSIVLGVLMASPVIFYEIYAFVKPALYENEKKLIYYYMGGFTGVLILGAAMSYFVVIPIVFKILIYFTMKGGAAPLINIQDFYSWIYTLLAINSLIYTIPIFVLLLIHVGILPAKYLRVKKRLMLYVAIFVIVWIFGPNPDPTGISDAIMMAPFFVVFEIAMFFAMRIDKERQRKKAIELGVNPSTNFVGKDQFRPTQEASTCKFCKAPVETSDRFCPLCKRSLK